MYESDTKDDLLLIIDQLWCINDPADFKMKGIIQNKYVEEPQILVVQCRVPDCKPQEELNTFLIGLSIELYNNVADYEPNIYT